MIPAQDTIAAVSTPFGEGAIAVLRLSGPRAVEIAAGLFQSRVAVEAMAARTLQQGRIVDGVRMIDEVLLAVHRGPASYTGEDVVEVQCHGGILVTRRILDLLLARGARVAQPGEFTQRAFLNGKMDLTRAEAVMDLIRAQTDLALRAATEQLSGALGRRIEALRAGLISILAHVEAHIDFPDEDIDPATGAALLARLDALRSGVADLLRTAGHGRVLREGLRTVIYGAPNAGKSSLLNRLLGYERAIVSHLPGTTRDTLEEVIDLRGIPVRLVDTAGIREPGDAIEQAGIARTWQAIDRAALGLQVADATQPPPELPGHAGALLVLNKCDLPVHESWLGRDAPIRISCATGEGFDALAEAIVAAAMRGAPAPEDHLIAINARHQACLKAAADGLDAARHALASGMSPEFAAIDLRAAMLSIGEVAGHMDSEELLDRIFSTFCIGK